MSVPRLVSWLTEPNTLKPEPRMPRAARPALFRIVPILTPCRLAARSVMPAVEPAGTQPDGSTAEPVVA
jgi:hypothetical protein